MKLSAEVKGCLSVTIVLTLVVSGLFIYNSAQVRGADGYGLPAFASEQQLTYYLSTHGVGHSTNLISIDQMETASGASVKGAYTDTNNQEVGVDELDIIETDGQYIYSASYDRIDIVRAIPANEMANVSFILASQLVANEGSWSYIQGIFLTDAGLVVILNVYERSWHSVEYISDYYGPYDGRTLLCLVDVSDPSAPNVVSSFGVSGYLMSAREHDGTVYVLAQQSIWSGNDIATPIVWDGSVSSQENVSSIRYDPNGTKVSSYTNIMAFDLATLHGNTTSLLMGYGSITYASGENLYVTSTTYETDEVTGVMLEVGHTNIYRLHLDGTDVTPNGVVGVDGTPLNQFSLDEHEGYLRIATTSGWASRENMVFIIDEDMRMIGELRGIARNESIRSALFIDDTLYLVTFFQTDPLFVIDVSNPWQPQIMGELVMPGFSSYLQSVGNGLLLGVGFENSTLKLSLYDVNDPIHPMVLANLVAPIWTWSEAGYDHHAFMYDAASGIIGIPVWMYGQTVDQGSFIYHLDGRELKFEGALTGNGPSARCLMIDGVLYTVSSTMVCAWNASDLSKLGEVVFRGSDDPIYLYRDGTTNIMA